jgi:hypothetical protein
MFVTSPQAAQRALQAQRGPAASVELTPEGAAMLAEARRAIGTQALPADLPAVMHLQPVPRLDVTTTHAPRPGEPVSVDRTREGIGERLLLLLGSMLRAAASAKKAQTELPVVLPEKTFAPELEGGLYDALHLDPTAPDTRPFLQALAAEFFDWATRSGQTPDDIRFRVDDRGTLWAAPVPIQTIHYAPLKD